jgi:hypothetical protein
MVLSYYKERGRGFGKESHFPRMHLKDYENEMARKCNCELCNRKAGRPRKNKEYFDEARNVTIETGTVTKLVKQKLTFYVKHPWLHNDLFEQSLKLYLCQDCITRINIEESSYILRPNYGVTKGRFLRKNELITDIFISVKINPKKDELSYPPIKHYVDALDYFIYAKYGNEIMNRPTKVN